MYSIVWFVKMASMILSAAYSAGRMSRISGHLKMLSCFKLVGLLSGIEAVRTLGEQLRGLAGT